METRLVEVRGPGGEGQGGAALSVEFPAGNQALRKLLEPEIPKFVTGQLLEERKVVIFFSSEHSTTTDLDYPKQFCALAGPGQRRQGGGQHYFAECKLNKINTINR